MLLLFQPVLFGSLRISLLPLPLSLSLLLRPDSGLVVPLSAVSCHCRSRYGLLNGLLFGITFFCWPSCGTCAVCPSVRSLVPAVTWGPLLLGLVVVILCTVVAVVVAGATRAGAAISIVMASTVG